jgi:endoglucanase
VGQTSHWAAATLQGALEAGWYDWDELPPTGEGFDKPITRQVAVKVLMRALLPDVQGDYTTDSAKMADFSDLDGRYYDAVLAAYHLGVAKGDQNGSFHPKKSLTRAEACALIRRALALTGASADQENPGQSVPTTTVTRSGGVSENGWLQVKGTQLCNEQGQAVVLRGMSSHGLQWYSNFTSAQSIQNVADAGANLFRVAMYTGEGGYLSQPEVMWNKMVAAIDAAIANDLYVIADWHILSDGNPRTNQSQAVDFFTRLSQRYGDNPAVIYEICNEPNGAVTWSGDVKPYAQTLVNTIRKNAPQSIILIGSTTWSQDIHLAAADPVKGTNLMYTLHFYAGTHGAELRERIDSALKKGLPIFVSEWGTSRADGSGGVYLAESKVWLDFLDSRGISWANWSLCDKNETSAALKPGTSPNAKWTQKDLTESGRFVFSRFGTS